jgi:hypothetical protein
MSQVIPEYVVSRLAPLESVGGDSVAWRLAFHDAAGDPVVHVIVRNEGMFDLIEMVLQRMGYTAEEIHKIMAFNI